MLTINSMEELSQVLADKPGVGVLFGGEHCNVCNVIKPKLKELMAERCPKVFWVYVDCQKTMDICSQNSIFSLPVVRVYFENQMFVEKARSFSLVELADEIERPYSMVFSAT